MEVNCLVAFPSYAEAVASAQSILKGCVRSYPFAEDSNDRERLRLAAQLMLNDVEHGMHEDWGRANQEDVGGEANSPRLTGERSECHLLDDQRCPCGRWVTMDTDATDSFESVEHDSFRLDDLSHRIVPAFWHLHLHSSQLTLQRRRMRRESVEAFPAAMYVAAYLAHADQCASIRARAWAVLDAVDVGHRLIPALASLLMLTPSAVRASRRLPRPWFGERVSLGRYRRLFRALDHARKFFLVPPEELHEARWMRWLPVIDALSRSTEIRFKRLMEFAHRHASVLASLPAKPNGRHRRSQLRHWIRYLRTIRLTTHSAATSDATFIDMVFATTKRERLIGRDFNRVLPCGWTVQSIVSARELRREGRNMGHCIASYADKLLAGAIEVLSFCSADCSERATLMIEPPFLNAESPEIKGWRSNSAVDDFSDDHTLTLAGPDNAPIPAKVVIALGEFLASLNRTNMHVTFQ
jgi:hypothetical protein